MRDVYDLHQGWGEGIADRLRELGRSQRWLAQVCDVHPTTIKRTIDGTLCANDLLKFKIAGALGVRMDQMFPWPKIVPPHPQHNPIAS